MRCLFIVVFMSVLLPACQSKGGPPGKETPRDKCALACYHDYIKCGAEKCGDEDTCNCKDKSPDDCSAADPDSPLFEQCLKCMDDKCGKARDQCLGRCFGEKGSLSPL